MNDFDTPMMKQYKEIKERYPDTFIFFRCGDFYEIFGSDAVTVSRILNITLTKRGDVQMCGVPHHSVQFYIGKMVRAGKKVAICEQLEDPKTVKGLVKRDVQEIITPGTLLEEKLLNNKANNFLLTLNIKGLYIEISYLDISTGDFEFQEIEYSNDLSVLKGELVRIAPKEIIISEDIWVNDKNIRETFDEFENILINRYPIWYFENRDDQKRLFDHLGINSFKDVGITEPKTDVTTPAVLLKYLTDNLKANLDHIKKLKYNSERNSMILDEQTIRNLELLKNQHDGTNINTLLETLDMTQTNMGARLLKKWIIEPLIDSVSINERLSIVSYFYHNEDILDNINDSVKKVMDLERLVSRLVSNKATPKDLVSIKESLKGVEEIHKKSQNIKELNKLLANYKELGFLILEIDRTIKDEPATLINEGNIVKDGYSETLDRLREISDDSKEYITKIEQMEKERLNIPTLKIKYNKIIGYFFEVSKIQSKNLDDKYILRQQLVNVYRYTNKELSEYESKVLTAKDEINEIEEKIFYEMRDKIVKHILEIQDNARIVAEIDVYLSFSKVSLKNHYTKPVINENESIIIKEGRHPVVEKKLDIDSFIPNDIDMDTNKDYLMIITGPNMSGKSTFLRQNALIVLMAQMGCFVPASEATIGVVDRIFTRIGTSDNLARGESTFLVEMKESANILKNATKKSLIIMDELGRGTSTYDGLSIAWSLLEYIHDKRFIGAKTLFATHYHELTALEKKEGIKNLSVMVSESDDEITFLHKIVAKASEKSYGIHVAKLASLPKEVTDYAELILKRLEKDKDDRDIKDESSSILKGDRNLFDIVDERIPKKEVELLDKIRYFDLDRITPIQALNILHDIQKKLKL